VDNSLMFGLSHNATLGTPGVYVPVALIQIAQDSIQAPALTDPSQLSCAAGFLLAYGGTNQDDHDVWARVRGANVFKHIVATAAGATTVWTPPGSTRWRLLGFVISVAGTLAATAPLRVDLRDNGTNIWSGFATVSDTTPVGDAQLGADYGLIGLPSSGFEQDLTVNLSAAMLTGGVAVNAWGVQELDH
jgi:hypothetical protein